MHQIDPNGKGNIWIGGDFNLPHIDWARVKHLPQNTNVKLSNRLIDCMNDLSMHQVIDQPTRKNNILDLFFSTNLTLVNRITTAPPLTVQADHDIVFIDLNTRAHLPRKPPNKRYLYNKADWDSMRNKMASYVLPTASVQKQWNHLEETIKSLIESFVPSAPPKPVKHKPWMTRDVITLLHRRNRAFKSWKAKPTPENHEKYTSFRSTCQQKQRQAYKACRESIFNPEDHDSSKSMFWHFIKRKRKDTSSVAPMGKDGVLLSDPQGKANILNKQYSSIFTPEKEETTPTSPPARGSVMPHIIVNPDGVKNLLASLKPNKAAGPDQISPRVLKELANELYRPLSVFFQNSIDSGTVPEQWKQAIVTPIFKKGDKHNPANYRPFFLTAVCYKLLEHIVSKALLSHLEANEILIERQHGFRRSRSCETQLVLFVDELVRSLCACKLTDAVVMDFSKAFDVVPHNSLLVKLSCYGIQNKTLNWIA